MGLVLQLVEVRADGQTRSVEVMEISRPGDLRDVAKLGLRGCQSIGEGTSRPQGIGVKRLT